MANLSDIEPTWSYFVVKWMNANFAAAGQYRHRQKEQQQLHRMQGLAAGVKRSANAEQTAPAATMAVT